MTSFIKKLMPVVRRDPRYAYEAYEFVSQALVHLYDFAVARSDIGLEPDPAPVSQLPPVAVVKYVHDAGDVAFDVHLPTANGELAFVAFPWPGWYGLASAAGVLPAVTPPPP